MVTIRTNLKPGDVGTVIRMHGVIHHAECGFDPTFEAYVAIPLGEFVKKASPRERLWLAEREGEVIGCIAIVTATAMAEDVAQLRWFLVDPSARGQGLGKKLLDESLAFCRASKYTSVILWTVSSLEAAARLYRAAGFIRTVQKSGRVWGVDVVEEMYALKLG
jgi:GNAT superfamily N-acetyltransferase